jgi:peroxiredoxin
MPCPNGGRIGLFNWPGTGLNEPYAAARPPCQPIRQRKIQMTIKEGDKIPEATLMHMTADGGPGQITTAELFDGKKVALFSVPGAFTPTCSAQHLPGFIEQADAIKGKGVDTIACMAVNDAFVMDAWGKDRGVGDKIEMLADGNGDFTRALGLELDATGFGLGQRGQRFSLIADDGVVTKLNVEEGGAFEVSKAEVLLQQLG